MITFAAFTPHSPLLIDSIGKENASKLDVTRQSMKRLSEELYASHPDVILLVGTQRHAHVDAFSANVHDEYVIDFTEFGDLSTHAEFAPDLELITAMQTKMQSEKIPFTLDSESTLDYGAGVPLTLLARFPKTPSLIPVSYCELSPKIHVQFGRVLHDVCVASKKRIAIIVAGDLSHTLTSDAPAGFHESGVAFDEAILQAINHVSISQLLSLDPSVVSHARESAYRPLLILFGLLEHMSIRPEILSYEHPFGVGELVAQFHFSS